MSAARDFINKVILPECEIYGYYPLINRIKLDRALWDKPDHIAEVGVVDEEAFEEAFTDNGYGDMLFVVRAYEKAKLDKLTGKTDSAKPPQEVHSLSGVGDSQPMPTKEELPPLPEKRTESVQVGEFDYQYTYATQADFNALIDYVAALGKTK